MFTRKHTTVAAVMETLRRTINDLEAIVMQNITLVDTLHAERNKLDIYIEDVDLEIHQARGTADSLSDLTFGPDKDNEA